MAAKTTFSCLDRYLFSTVRTFFQCQHGYPSILLFADTIALTGQKRTFVQLVNPPEECLCSTPRDFRCAFRSPIAPENASETAHGPTDCPIFESNPQVVCQTATRRILPDFVPLDGVKEYGSIYHKAGSVFFLKILLATVQRRRLRLPVSAKERLCAGCALFNGSSRSLVSKSPNAGGRASRDGREINRRGVFNRYVARPR
jgi:hypothetical protein